MKAMRGRTFHCTWNKLWVVRLWKHFFTWDVQGVAQLIKQSVILQWNLKKITSSSRGLNNSDRSLNFTHCPARATGKWTWHVKPQANQSNTTQAPTWIILENKEGVWRRVTELRAEVAYVSFFKESGQNVVQAKVHSSILISLLFKCSNFCLVPPLTGFSV